LVWRNFFSRMAGEGKKDLVQAGLAEREVGNPHAGAAQRGDRDRATIGV
jgi:hypothetical protein